ncbi:hypothetical protein FGO68_gene13720 [Halteria grandinella]|uniref:Uncharacterized protein n=1 Tax=Halteria grandinella TaxID=5974 RepID=A0A8J8NCZ2_HALGN|nr:hypothetical protein FGO68_gene13720 [Halteria grandinella]
MNDPNTGLTGSSLPPISNQRQLLIGVSGKEKGEMLKDFSVVEDSETQPLYQSGSHLRIGEDQPTALKDTANQTTKMGVRNSMDAITRDVGAKSPMGGMIDIALPLTRQDSGYYHQSSSLPVEVHSISPFIAPPGSLDELMMAKVKKENQALENVSNEFK